MQSRRGEERRGLGPVTAQGGGGKNTEARGGWKGRAATLSCPPEQRLVWGELPAVSHAPRASDAGTHPTFLSVLFPLFLFSVFFMSASCLLPVCSQSASCLFPACFLCASGLLPVCLLSASFFLSPCFLSASFLSASSLPVFCRFPVCILSTCFLSAFCPPVFCPTVFQCHSPSLAGRSFSTFFLFVLTKADILSDTR